jgi:hypothetical protein
MSLKAISFFRWIALAGLFCVWLPCQAQFSSNVQGTVTDATGAVVTNVAITLHNTGTGVDLKGKTNSTGYYRFTSVAPGEYTVIATAAGFKTSSTSVTVTADETRGVDITFQVGTASSDVTVSGVASALNPDETRVQSTLTSQEISQLPLPNRDVQLLLALTPGVVGYQNESPSNGYGSSIFAGNFQPPYTANGEGVQGNLFLIDDLPVQDDITQGAAMILPNAEMINQVALQSQTYSVENGTSASIQTSFSTKSGGNSFHGSADYSYAGKNIGAADQPVHSPASFGDPTVTNTSPEFHQDLFLASMGGPILKDRTFFFGSIERQNAGIGAATGTNPYFTQSFATWAVGAFPNSPAAYGLNFAPPTRDAIGNGQVKTAADYYPTTCGTTQTVAATQGSPTPLTYNIPCDQTVNVVGGVFNQAQPFDGLQWNIRLDQSLRNGNDRIYVMYERIDQKTGNLAERPALDAVTPSQNKYFSVNYIHLFSPRLLNEAHFGNLRAIEGSQLGDIRAVSVPYLPILNASDTGFTFPFGTTPFAAQTNKEHTYALRDTVSYTLRNHSIRGGYQFYRGDAFQDSSTIYSRPFVPFYSTDAFSWVSNTATAGYNLYTIGGNGKYTPQLYGATSIYNGVFVEDSWKVRPNLTITAGIRYDDFGNPTKYGSTAQPFVPLFPGSGSTFQQQAWDTHTKIAANAFTQSQNLNFLPRVGFAYSRPTTEHPMLIRGGIGLYENAMTPFQITSNLPTQPPNRISLFNYGIVPYGDFSSGAPPYGYNYPATPVFGTDPFGNIYSNAAQTSVYSANLNGFVPNIKPEKFLNYSLGIEQQLPANVVLGITYSGSHGYDLIYGSSASGGGGNDDYNLTPNSPDARPTSEWGTLNYGRNGLTSNYNALIVTLKQNYKHLTYQANYNFSRALQYAPSFTDGSTGDSYSVWKGIYDPKSYYGPTAFDRTNTFSFGGTYEVPKLARGYLLNEVASGWRIGSIIIAQSGTPFTVDETGIDYQNDGGYAFDGAGGATPAFPTFNGTKRKGFTRTQALNGVFTQSQFSNPAGVGTEPVTSQQGANTFRNLGYFNVDATVSKGFNIPFPGRADGVKFYLRGEAVNLLNRTNWQNIVSGWAAPTVAPTFGSVTAADQKRYLQLGGRFEF